MWIKSDLRLMLGAEGEPGKGPGTCGARGTRGRTRPRSFATAAAGRGRRCTRPQTCPPWSKPKTRRSRARVRPGRVGVKSKRRLSEAALQRWSPTPQLSQTLDTAAIPRPQPDMSQIPCPNSGRLSRPRSLPAVMHRGPHSQQLFISPAR